ncbi:ABC transporter ATP-binding protein [Salinithrix halophila]|uniref:ABC transporter ATP-binding protein n=1 Tax=Salinithrix halophila TaxID=1485204 RepID=A0ABV8JG29_9BACL
MREVPAAIEVNQVTKVFDKQTILDHIDLTVPKGEIHGLIGRNGSGKTMLLQVICGLIKPTEGAVTVMGEPLQKGSFPKQLGALIEQPGFLPGFSGKKNLELLASIQGTIGNDEIEATLRSVGLDPALKAPVRKYSMGMRQRLGIAQAIMEKPRVLLLDEPTNALDEEGLRDVHQLLLNLRDQGVTILIASHNREEIDGLCDHVHRMEKGKLTS